MSEYDSGSNMVDGAVLRGLVERLERIAEDKKALSADATVVMAEAKSLGFDPKYIRALIKLRKLAPSERDEHEAMMDLYIASMGMARETPLFRAVDAMGVDTAAKASVIEALKLLAPSEGDILFRMGGQPVRVWRDEDGTPQVEDWVEPKPQPSSASRGSSTRSGPARPAAPDCSEDAAEVLGSEAAKADQPIIANPFPWDDPRRPRWDLGWRKQAGSDGMGPPEPGDGGGDT